MAGKTRTSLFLKASALLVLLFFIPGTAGQGSHGLSDHHAFLAGRSEISAGEFLQIQVNHTYFRWGTIWYSARVDIGASIAAFMVDGDNLERFRAGENHQALKDTSSGPAAMTGGLTASLPKGIYYLIVVNPGPEDVDVKWEVFLEPRLSGGPRALDDSIGSASPALIDSFLVLLILLTAGGVAIIVVWRVVSRKA